MNNYYEDYEDDNEKNNNANNNINNNIINNSNVNNKIINSNEVTKREDKPYIVLTDEELKNKKKKNKAMTYMVYAIFLMVAALVVYMYKIDKYEFYIKKDEVLLSNGSSYQIELTPKNEKYYKVTNYKYESEDERIAKVDEYGRITGESNGETEIKVRYKNGITPKPIKVKVENIEVKSVEINKEVEIKTEESEKVEAVINNKEEVKVNVEYEVEDESVAQIDDYGNINAVGEGETKIIARSKSGVEGETTIKIEKNEEEAERIEISEKKIEILKGTSTKLYGIITPENAVNQTITWTSDSENVEVDKNGKITGKM